MNGAWTSAAAAMCLLAQSAASAGSPLERLRWSSRVLMVFTPTLEEPLARRTEALLADRRCELDDRDLIVLRVPAQERRAADREALSGNASAALRRDFDVPDDAFRVVLIGKDGGEKLRVDGVPDLDRLFALIDGMPMRRAEMRERATSCGG